MQPPFNLVINIAPFKVEIGITMLNDSYTGMASCIRTKGISRRPSVSIPRSSYCLFNSAIPIYIDEMKMFGPRNESVFKIKKGFPRISRSINRLYSFPSGTAVVKSGVDIVILLPDEYHIFLFRSRIPD